MAKRISKSEFLAADSMAADMANWITYVVGETKESLNSWLESNRPSQITRDDGVGWISVTPHTLMKDDDESDPRGLQESFEALKKSGRGINFRTICELAKQHHVLRGKWMIYVKTGLKIDHLWSLVATATAAGKLGTYAKVSVVTTEKNYPKDNSHVVNMYVKDFTNEEEVMELEAAIRRAGIRVSLTFKPSVYSSLGVYSGNEWGLKPTIYESYYSILEGKSQINRVADHKAHQPYRRVDSPQDGHTP